MKFKLCIMLLAMIGLVGGSSQTSPAYSRGKRERQVEARRQKEERVIATIHLLDADGRDAGDMSWNEWINGGCEDLHRSKTKAKHG